MRANGILSNAQYCQFDFFLGQFYKFWSFSTPLAFFRLKKAQMNSGQFGPTQFLCRVGRSKDEFG